MPELKELCRARKLGVSGTKAVLIARLLGQDAPAKKAPKATSAQDASSTTLSSLSSLTTSGPASLGPSQGPTRTSSLAAAASSTSLAAPASLPTTSKGKGKKTKAPEQSAGTKSAKRLKTIHEGSGAAQDDSSTVSSSSTIEPKSNTSAIAAVPSTSSSNTTNVMGTKNISRASVATASRPAPKTPSSLISAEIAVPQASIPAKPVVERAAATSSKRSTPFVALSVQKEKAPVPNTSPSAAVGAIRSNTPRVEQSNTATVPYKPKAPVKFKALVPTKKPGPPPQAAASKPIFQKDSIEALFSAHQWLFDLLRISRHEDLLPCASSASSSCETVRAGLAFHSTRIYTRLGQEEDITPEEVAALPKIRNIEIINEDIACITTISQDVFHIIISTGEVIGTSSISVPPASETSLDTDEPSPEKRVLRADWSKLVDEAAGKQINNVPVRLVEKVQSPDIEHFKNGISKHYLTRLGSMADQNEASALLNVAESYVLAHVAPSAVSGSYKSILDQQAEFSGNVQGETKPVPPARHKVSLYLPLNHQVESVSTAGLHPAVAVVQTIQRAHYVLRATGQIIGDEDEGIFPRFQEVLHCNSTGKSVR